MPTPPIGSFALAPATLFRSCSDNSVVFGSHSASSSFFAFSLIVFLLFRNVSFVNSPGRRSAPNQLNTPYKVQTNKKRGHSLFPVEQSEHEPKRPPAKPLERIVDLRPTGNRPAEPRRLHPAKAP